MRRRTSDAVLLGLLAVALVAWAAVPFFVHGARVPLGSDAPVYLWWARLAAHEGLSAVGDRPGAPALALAIAGALHLPANAALAALEIAGIVTIGLAGAAIARTFRREDPSTWCVTGFLTGTFASHLAAGYVANLLFAAMFLGAVVALAHGTPRGAIAAALLLGSAGITHPIFLALAVAAISAAALLSIRSDAGGAGRELAAAAGGIAIAGLSAIAMLAGPDALRVDTSRDALLRRAGLTDILGGAYLERLGRFWPRYAPWASLPLAMLGGAVPRDFVRRLMASWVIVTVVGVGAAVATRAVPPARFLDFAFFLPLLAGAGATRIARTPRVHRTLARALAGLVVVAMLVGAGLPWFRQRPFFSVRELTRLEHANAAVASVDDAALVFPVGSSWGAYPATRAANLLRATVPPDRIRSVVVQLADRPTTTEGEGVERITTEDVAAALAVHGGRAQRVLVVPFALGVSRSAPWTPIATGVYVDPPVTAASRPVDPLLPSSPIAMVLAGIAALTLVGLIGRTAARAIGLDRIDALLVAPAFGIAAMVLAAVAVDRLGFRLVGWVAPLAASALAAAIGLGARFLAEIDAGAEPRA